jgi:peptidoglycan/LPS O-acetylase OafA/YrhL
VAEQRGAGGQYFPQIDGLRAVAVIAVLVYHLRLGDEDGFLLPGGFLGVDIFFVISGFLITRILLTELDATGRVSIGRFYARRARRILPALLAVILASIPVGWALLLPSEFKDFGLSLIASLGFVGNAYWYVAQSAYGAPGALTQPFLHTWSLGVEEQFYIAFPLLLVLLHRWRRVGAGLALLVVAGFALAVLTTTVSASLSFYSPLSRIWELAAGSALAWATLRHPGALKSPAWTRALPGLGLAILLWELAFRDFHDGNHPGLSTLPTILATALIIWFATPRDPVTRFLSCRPMIGVGLISYALYLWHFPVFAFGRRIDATPEIADKLVWTAFAILLSVLTWFAIERPFRVRLSSRSFGLSTALASLGIAAAGMRWPRATTATSSTTTCCGKRPGRSSMRWRRASGSGPPMRACRPGTSVTGCGSKTRARSMSWWSETRTARTCSTRFISTGRPFRASNSPVSRSVPVFRRISAGCCSRRPISRRPT